MCNIPDLKQSKFPLLGPSLLEKDVLGIGLDSPLLGAGTTTTKLTGPRGRLSDNTGNRRKLGAQSRPASEAR